MSFIFVTVSWWPVTSITFWLNAYLIIELCSFSPTFVERFPGSGEDFVFSCISTALLSMDSLVSSHVVNNAKPLPDMLHLSLPLCRRFLRFFRTELR